MSISAQQTILTTRIPENNCLRLLIEGEGTVIINGNAYDSSTEITLKDDSVVEIFIEPTEKWMMKSIQLNGKDITKQSINNTLFIECICNGDVLKIVFEEKNIIQEIIQVTTPSTGDSKDYELYTFLFINSIIIIGCMMKSSVDKRI